MGRDDELICSRLVRAEIDNNGSSLRKLLSKTPRYWNNQNECLECEINYLKFFGGILNDQFETPPWPRSSPNKSYARITGTF